MKDYTAADRRLRERLERNSSAGVRANIVADLNKVAGDHAAHVMPGLGAYGTIRLRQDNGSQARTVRQHNANHDKWFAKAAAEPDLAGSDDARDEEFVPELRADRIRDAGGSVRATT